ncbi:MAG: hypothetical protein JSR80_01440 [Verrucomicrobia bacterium]|nr:hypothetical protein [Verrucomicrobiota bacterium]
MTCSKISLLLFSGSSIDNKAAAKETVGVLFAPLVGVASLLILKVAGKTALEGNLLKQPWFRYSAALGAGFSCLLLAFGLLHGPKNLADKYFPLIQERTREQHLSEMKSNGLDFLLFTSLAVGGGWLFPKTLACVTTASVPLFLTFGGLLMWKEMAGRAS